MQISDYKEAFFTIHFVFSQLDTDHFDLNFRLLDENNDTAIPNIFVL